MASVVGLAAGAVVDWAEVTDARVDAGAREAGAAADVGGAPVPAAWRL